MKNTEHPWSELASAFHRDGLVVFPSGLALDVRLPIQWAEPFPQLQKLRLTRSVCNWMELMSAAGYGFRPLHSVTPVERAAGDGLAREALTQSAVGEVEELAPSPHTDWTFAVTLVGATQFLARVESELRLVIARVEPDTRTPPEVLDLLARFVKIDREQYELEAQRITSLAAQGERTPSSIQ